MIVGGGAVFAWKFLVRPMGGAWNIYELLPAFLLSLAVNIAVSLCTKAPDESITRVFDEVKAGMRKN